MNEKVLKCLYDIKLAIEETDSFFIGRQKLFDEYAKDMMLNRLLKETWR